MADTLIDPLSLVRDFHQAFGHPIKSNMAFGLADEKTNALRLSLIEEELRELKQAMDQNDIVEVADALGDLVYVIYGAALVWGIDLSAVVSEIHRSNMTKLGADHKPVYREDGKILKGPNYRPPDIAGLLTAIQAKQLAHACMRDPSLLSKDPAVLETMSAIVVDDYNKKYGDLK